MSAAPRGSLDVRFVWPVEELELLTREARVPTAVAVLLESADDFDGKVLATGLCTRLVAAGVELIALSGAEAEAAHDALDWRLDEEAAGAVVMTTWHAPNDPEGLVDTLLANVLASELVRVWVVADRHTEAGERLERLLAESPGL
jgi:hypothetical protein